VVLQQREQRDVGQERDARRDVKGVARRVGTIARHVCGFIRRGCGLARRGSGFGRGRRFARRDCGVAWRGCSFRKEVRQGIRAPERGPFERGPLRRGLLRGFLRGLKIRGVQRVRVGGQRRQVEYRDDQKRQRGDEETDHRRPGAEGLGLGRRVHRLAAGAPGLQRRSQRLGPLAQVAALVPHQEREPGHEQRAQQHLEPERLRGDEQDEHRRQNQQHDVLPEDAKSKPYSLAHDSSGRGRSGPGVQCGFGHNQVELRVVGLPRQRVDHLAIVGEADGKAAAPGQVAVVVPAALAQPVAA